MLMTTTELLFTFCNTGILFFWMLLLFLPKRKITQKIMTFPWIPLGLSFFYAYFLFGFGGLAEADFSRLDGILTLFKEATPESAAAGWLHYLAFDFWMGSWMLKNSQQKGIPHPWMIAPMLGTFLLGPLGVLVYSLVYFVHSRLNKK